MKGNSLIVKVVVALGSVPSHAGNVRGFLEKILAVVIQFLVIK